MLRVDTSDRVRLAYEALTPAQRAQVADLLKPALATGWVPKPSDLEAAIARVLHAHQPE